MLVPDVDLGMYILNAQFSVLGVESLDLEGFIFTYFLFCEGWGDILVRRGINWIFASVQRR